MNTGLRPLILVSNDDGVGALGVRRLASWLEPFGDVVVVCPEGPQSGKSMAITVNDALRITSLPDAGSVKYYKVNGTPVDCVKLAMHRVMPRIPDLVVAGINHGSNSAINVVYSGTMGAVMEGCAFGIPSVGFSLTDHAPDANFEPCRPWVEKIVRGTLENGLPEGVCLNVNIPDTDHVPEEMRVVRAAKGKWTDEYQEYTDPHGHKFYWLTGKFDNQEPDCDETDEWCLHHGIVSVVPVTLDRTATGISSIDWLRRL